VTRCALLVSTVSCCTLVFAQSSTIPAKVRSIFVGEITGMPEAGAIRQALTEELRRHGKPALAGGPDAADGTLTGTGQLWVKGYYNLNPRERSLGEGAHRVYGGYLSVELRDRKGEVLWSYLVTPRRGYDSVSHDLAGQVVKRLQQAIEP
jgi:hypothetical protein